MYRSICSQLSCGIASIYALPSTRTQFHAQVNCLRNSCEVGTYLDILVNPIGDLPAESEVCRPCDELCEACIGPGTALTVCSVCTHATRLEEGCVRECDPVTGE